MTAATLAIEVAVPFLTFFPRRLRMAGAWLLIALQVFIAATGNYTFFNLLALALCLFLFDDQALGRFVPQEIRNVLPGRPFFRGPAIVAAALVMFLSLTHLLQTFTGRLPAPLNAALRYSAPLQIVNTYGLFAVMTTTRLEIILEGSPDGESWTPYEFRYKPGNPNRAPGWVAPYQPRLDWQMWFAALGTYQSSPWFVNMAVQLLQGSPEVSALLASNPFPNQPPRFIRALAYDYTFTDFATRRRTGAWWKREPKGQYLPAVGLRPAQSP
jgi:lipase maturation factor 1